MAGTLGFSSSVTFFCSSVNSGQSSVPLAAPNQRSQRRADSASTSGEFLSRFPPIPAKRFPSVEVHATLAQAQAPKWWERNAGPNMIDIHSTQEFLDALSQAGDRLVIVEFYATWCASCKALFPKLCRTAQDHREILFLKVNFDENKAMCKNLNVKVLPYFHFYRGSDGQLESFTCSLAKFQKIKDAIELHNTARCSIGPPLLTAAHLTLETLFVGKDLPATSSSSSSL